jgi:hypothetical protein
MTIGMTWTAFSDSLSSRASLFPKSDCGSHEGNRSAHPDGRDLTCFSRAPPDVRCISRCHVAEDEEEEAEERWGEGEGERSRPVVGGLAD